MTHERVFTDSDEVEVFSRWWEIESLTGVVVISHGASEHSGRYDRFAQALNRAGLAAVAVDHRGHGRTAQTTSAIMGAGGGQAVVDDLHELSEAARAIAGTGVPIFLFGYSMGSLIALAYATQDAGGFAGCVLCGMPAEVNEAATLGALLEGFDNPDMRNEPVGDLRGSNNVAFDQLERRSTGSAATRSRSTDTSPIRCVAKVIR